MKLYYSQGFGPNIQKLLTQEVQRELNALKYLTVNVHFRQVSMGEENRWKHGGDGEDEEEEELDETVRFSKHEGRPP